MKVTTACTLAIVAGSLSIGSAFAQEVSVAVLEWAGSLYDPEPWLKGVNRAGGSTLSLYARMLGEFNGQTKGELCRSCPPLRQFDRTGRSIYLI